MKDPRNPSSTLPTLCIDKNHPHSHDLVEAAEETEKELKESCEEEKKRIDWRDTR